MSEAALRAGSGHAKVGELGTQVLRRGEGGGRETRGTEKGTKGSEQAKGEREKENS